MIKCIWERETQENNAEKEQVSLEVLHVIAEEFKSAAAIPVGKIEPCWFNLNLYANFGVNSLKPPWKNIAQTTNTHTQGELPNGKSFTYHR